VTGIPQLAVDFSLVQIDIGHIASLRWEDLVGMTNTTASTPRSFVS